MRTSARSSDHCSASTARVATSLAPARAAPAARCSGRCSSWRCRSSSAPCWPSSAAWRGGAVDSAISSVLDILFAFPGILLAVLAAAVFGPGLTRAAIALAIAYTPVHRPRAAQRRAARASQPYIAALEVQGQPSVAICVRHLVPNVLPLIVAQAHDPVRLRDGRPRGDLVHRPRRAAAAGRLGRDGVRAARPACCRATSPRRSPPGLCIVVVVVAFNLLGERLADRTQEQR